MTAARNAGLRINIAMFRVVFFGNYAGKSSAGILVLYG